MSSSAAAAAATTTTSTTTSSSSPEYSRAMAAAMVAKANAMFKSVNVDSSSYRSGDRGFQLPKTYKLIKEVGIGTFGVVMSAFDMSTGKHVAIKRITGIFDRAMFAKRALREIKLLAHFNHHDNIIGIEDVILPPGSTRDTFHEIYIVQGLMESDLRRIIASKQLLTNSHVQYLIYQLLRGLACIHASNVLHRDIKPSNILVNGNCDLRIADFGLARGITVEADENSNFMTEYVATRWYRAPEIMLSFDSYTRAIDIWSVGCIFAEMLSRMPLFPGKDYVHQLNLILALLGSPSAECFRCIRSDKIKQYLAGLPVRARVPMSKAFPLADPLAVDLLEKMLVLNPQDRISAAEALRHPYFVPYQHLGADIIRGPFDFSFETQELKIDMNALRTQVWEEAQLYRRDYIGRPATNVMSPPRMKQNSFLEQQIVYGNQPIRNTVQCNESRRDEDVHSGQDAKRRRVDGIIWCNSDWQSGGAPDNKCTTYDPAMVAEVQKSNAKAVLQRKLLAKMRNKSRETLSPPDIYDVQPPVSVRPTTNLMWSAPPPINLESASWAHLANALNEPPSASFQSAVQITEIANNLQSTHSPISGNMRNIDSNGCGVRAGDIKDGRTLKVTSPLAAAGVNFDDILRGSTEFDYAELAALERELEVISINRNPNEHIITAMQPAPPLPPPPPPLSVVERQSLQNPSGVRDATTTWTKSSLIVDVIQLIEKQQPRQPSSLRLTCTLGLPSVLQEGPCCGFVAIDMATRWLGLSRASSTDVVSSLLHVAREMNVSRHGELFNATALPQLIYKVFGDDAVHVDVQKKEHGLTASDVATAILCESPMLVPYDAEKDNRPGCFEGLKAHWAALHGFVISISDDDGELMRRMSVHGTVVGEGILWLNHSRDNNASAIASLLTLLNDAGSHAEMDVIALHGKSRKLALWSLNDLVKSSLQLQLVHPTRSEMAGYITPPNGDLRTCLSGQVVTLSRVHNTSIY